MTHPPDTHDARLSAYLDGALAPAEREAFERDMAADPALRDAVQAQRDIEDSIRRLFPVREAALPAWPEPKTSARPLRRWVWYAAAAAVLLTAAVAINRYVAGANPDFKLIAPDTLYAVLQNKGWQPEVVCTTNAQFAALVEKRLGAALIASPAAGVSLIGWGYGESYNGSPLSPKTVMLLTDVDQKHVLVLMDRESNDRTISVRPERGLRLFRRTVDGFVLYEITPLDEPRVIPLIQRP